MATKFFIVLFETDSKTIYLLQNFYICLICALGPPSWLYVTGVKLWFHGMINLLRLNVSFQWVSILFKVGILEKQISLNEVKLIQDGGQFDYLGENIARSKTDVKILQ